MRERRFLTLMQRSLKTGMKMPLLKFLTLMQRFAEFNNPKQNCYWPNFFVHIPLLANLCKLFWEDEEWPSYPEQSWHFPFQEGNDYETQQTLNERHCYPGLHWKVQAYIQFFVCIHVLHVWIYYITVKTYVGYCTCMFSNRNKHLYMFSAWSRPEFFFFCCHSPLHLSPNAWDNCH